MYILCEIYIYIIFVLHLLNPIPVGGGKNYLRFFVNNSKLA